MDIVIDASSIIAVIANEPEKTVLIERTRGANLYAPASVHWEIGNAFSAMLKRNRINLVMAQEAIEAYKRISLRFIEVDLSQAIDLSAKLGVYAYDAYVILAALDQRCSLLTLDLGLTYAAKLAGVNILEIKS